MRPLRIKSDYSNYNDLDRIARVLAEHEYTSTPEQCELLWELYSESVCTGWLDLPETDADLFECVRPYIDESD